MQWTDEGIVLGVKRHGETSVIVELMTRGHGRHLGLVRGGTGRMLRPVLQAGNLVSAVWRARLDQHLGQFTVEGIKLRVAALLSRVTRRLRRQLPRRAVPAVAGARPTSDGGPDDRGGARPHGRSAGGGGADRAFRIAASDRTRFRPRARPLCGHRHRRGARLRVAEIGPGGVAGGGRALAGAAPAAAGVSCIAATSAIPHSRIWRTRSR